MALKLLVADDSVTIQKVIGLAFADRGAVIEAIQEGKEALDAVKAFQPDLALVDICMPGKNGYEICSLIKNNPETEHIPVVLLVGTFDKFDESEASKARYDARLTKPFDTNELVHVVQKLALRNAKAQANVPDDIVCLDKKETPLNKCAQDKMVFNTKLPVSERSLNSFFGESRVLDIFEAETAGSASLHGLCDEDAIPSSATTDLPAAENLSISADALPDEVLDRIVEKVVK
ncbi:MAG: response regulator, partial [Acidobacteriota bacterium]